jgi:hypothetical protein
MTGALKNEDFFTKVCADYGVSVSNLTWGECDEN